MTAIWLATRDAIGCSVKAALTRFTDLKVPMSCSAARVRHFIYGGPGADELFGMTGKDDVEGEGGNDVLYGGRNTDALEGDPVTTTITAPVGMTISTVSTTWRTTITSMAVATQREIPVAGTSTTPWRTASRPRRVTPEGLLREG